MSQIKHSKLGAFTLFELMIAVAIMAILASLAYASYTDSVRKSHRGGATAALTGLAGSLQRYYTEQTPSTYAGAAIGTVFPEYVPLDGTVKTYRLSIQSATGTAFAISATPINAQANDKCGTLTLTSAGVRGVSGTGVTVQQCWR